MTYTPVMASWFSRLFKRDDPTQVVKCVICGTEITQADGYRVLGAERYCCSAAHQEEAVGLYSW